MRSPELVKLLVVDNLMSEFEAYIAEWNIITLAKGEESDGQKVQH